MKVVFLDIDGVVNTFQFYKEPPINIPKEKLKFIDGYYVDICSESDLRVSNTQAMILLDRLCHKYNLKIVISSTWRFQYNKCCKALYNSGLEEDIEIIGHTPHLGTERGYEIQSYLQLHPEITNYIILDDDADMLPNQINHLILTNNYIGFNFNDYIKAEQMMADW